MTDLAARFGKALVIAPHADDEVLGCGALLAALSRAGLAPEVAIVSQGHPPDYPAGQVAALKAEAARAHAILGVAATHWLGLPAARLDTLPHADLNAAIGRLVAQVRPDTLLLPFPGDIHLDHQLVFRSGLVAARPAGPHHPRLILCYETLSETNWNAPALTPAFAPTLFADATATLAAKLEAFGAYASQVRPDPHERSLSAVQALARLRGATVHLPAAEAFVLVRAIC